jgi:hypothetical protein
MADKKSSLVQIHQDVLDVDAQALKVAVVSGGGGGGGGGDVNLPAVVNSDNSSTALLGAGGIFTGTSFDAKDFATLSLSVTSDQSSAVNGISVQFSQDGTNWDHVHNYTYVAGANGLSYNLPVEMRYCRVVYTNGAIAQGSFRLQSVFRRTSVPPSVYTIEQGIEAKSIATPVKSVIFGETTGGGGGYVGVKVNPSGALTVEADVTGTVQVQNGVTYRHRARLVYSSTNVTTGAWTQLLAAVGSTEIKEIEIFDSSGETLELGIGAEGSEVVKSYVIPGGNGRIPLQIPVLSRLAIRAVSATANSGELIINMYG